ncbi:hypothetical protein [Catellatospora tritici]|uniref:hypothetical protein n=1 Tax=Catellatospora tritici TaxID=2851566 RepID=UPI001C2D7F2C|nr:hypothetical protein [Catellatospora tritici]MBV1849386.1 hypothetical protein [Catellatospora tritici]
MFADRRAVPLLVDFGGGAVTVIRHTPVVNLTGRGEFRVPAAGPVDWSQLDLLPECVTLEWAGAARGLTTALADRDIRYLYWDDAVGDVDLSGTRVTNVRLSGAGLRSVRLGGGTTSLMLRGWPPDLVVDAPEQGHRLSLTLFGGADDVTVPEGLRRVPTLWLTVDRSLSAAALADLTDLTDLRICFDQTPGTLTDLPELARHRLRRLQIDEAYDVDPGDLPELPLLECLELCGTRRSTARALRERFKGTPVRVAVDGAKSDAWLAKYLDNPFRDWAEQSRVFGLAACKAYTRARTAVDAVAADDPRRLALLEKAMRGLIADLNKIEEEHGLIDTINREHAGEVFDELARRVGVPSELADEWFDDRAW